MTSARCRRCTTRSSTRCSAAACCRTTGCSELVGDRTATRSAQQRLEDLIRQIMERLQESGYMTPAPDIAGRSARRQQGPGGQGEAEAPARFEVTDKALDFLGFRALRDLLGSLGKSSFGRHDTRDLATGIEASGATKPVRVRRHAEPGRERDVDQRDAAAAARDAVAGPARTGSRARGPGRRAGRVSELVRHGDHARLQPQHDPLWRGPLHAGQARRDGAVAADPPAVPGRQPASWCCSTTRPRRCRSRNWVA